MTSQQVKLHNGQKAVIPLPQGAPVQPVAKPVEQDLTTHIGRLRAARRRYEAVGQLDALWDCLGQMAARLDEIERAQ